MGLRSFHLLFIGLSIVLAAVVAAWAGQQYQTRHAASYAVAAGAALASGLGLALYAAAFQRKTRRLR